ncbi:MAG: septum site-determining protein MinC, partial [Thiomonas sp.]
SAPATPASAAAQHTLLIDRPLRSGQRVYSPGDLIVQGVVSHGAEVMAEGHVHIYGALRGRALAGARGNAAARIFCTSFEPELVAIAGIYRTAEQDLPSGVRGLPASVRLQGEQLLIEPLALK